MHTRHDDVLSFEDEKKLVKMAKLVMWMLVRCVWVRENKYYIMGGRIMRLLYNVSWVICYDYLIYFDSTSSARLFWEAGIGSEECHQMDTWKKRNWHGDCWHRECGSSFSHYKYLIRVLEIPRF